MYKFLLFISFFFILVGCNKTEDAYIINGRISIPELNGERVYLVKKGIGDTFIFMDSVQVKNNHFLFEGVQDSAIITSILFDHELTVKYNPLVFVLENGELIVTIDSLTSTVSGTELNEKFQKFNTLASKYYDELTSLSDELKHANETGKDSVEYQNMSLKFQTALSNFRALNISYINKNLDNVTGPYQFYKVRFDLTRDQLSDILQKSDNLFKQNIDVKNVVSQLSLTNKERAEAGKRYLDIVMPTPQGDTLSLSSFYGNNRFLVLYFWSSNSFACNKEFPAFLELYKYYRWYKIDFVGISLDTDYKSWTNNILNTQKEWPQISDLKGWSSDVCHVYDIKTIPSITLIDRNDTILGMNLSSKELKQELEKLIIIRSKTDSLRSVTQYEDSILVPLPLN